MRPEKQHAIPKQGRSEKLQVGQVGAGLRRRRPDHVNQPSDVTQGIPGGSKIETGKTNSSQGTHTTCDRAINNDNLFLPDVPLHLEVKLTTETNNPECSTLAYIGMALKILSMAAVIFLHYRKSKLCRGYRFSNIVKIVLFISDVQNYILIKLCKTSGSLHLFKIKGMLKLEDIKLNKNYLCDTLEINWNGIKLSFNGNEIDLPKIITIKMQDKIRIKRMINKESKFSHNDKTRTNLVQLGNRNRNSINL